MHRVALREPEREGAGAAEEIRQCPHPGEGLLGDGGKHRLACFCRLQKAAGGKGDENLAEGDPRRAALDDDRAGIGEPREIERVCGARELAGLGQFERPRAAQVDVEPLQRGRHADVERLAEASEIG